MKNIHLVSALSILVALGAIAPSNTNAQAKAKAQAWAIDGAHSNLGFIAKWAGQNVTGNFSIDAKSAIVNFDPNNLAGSNVSVNILMAGFSTPSKEARDNLPLADWLNTKSFPIANFSATNFKTTGKNTYFAQGALNFKGTKYSLPLPFNLVISGNKANMNASVTIDRANIKVGMDSDPKSEWVDRNVRVNVNLNAIKK